MAAAPPSAPSLALDMRDVGKRFGEIWVLRNVNYAVRAGSIHALVGHNGAGKSTLMKIALGGYAPTEGSVRISGRELTYSAPAEARRLGVGMVLQERSLIGTLTGLDNIFLNAEHVNAIGLLRGQEEWHEAKTLCEQLGIAPSVLRRRAFELSPVEQEMIEIAKAIRLARNVLILDEPTAPLTNREIKALFEIIRNAANLGVGIVLITHHLPEVFEISDEVTALREGIVTLASRTAETGMSQLVEAMLGHRLLATESTIAAAIQKSAPPSERGNPPRLEVRDLRVARKLNQGISFQLFPSEILGVAGLAGSGRTTLLRTLFGDFRPTKGSVKLNGATYSPGAPSAAIRKRVFLIPENRGVYGLVLSAQIVDNVILPILNRLVSFMIIRFEAGRRLSRRLMSVLDIRARGPHQVVGELSGGNQQKVVLAKALACEASLLLLDEPTFGVDVGAAAEVINQVRRLVESGNSALWVSSDLRELLEVADRVMILVDGQIHKVVKRGDPEFNEAHLVQSMQRGQVQQAATNG
jgi:ABC-type sugar transport system ATPase subunit